MKSREVRTVQNPAMLAVGARPDVLAVRQQSGVFFTRTGEPVRVGFPGLADAYMIVATTITPEMVGRTVGLCVQAEFKTADGRQRPEQKTWQQAVQQRGGIYELVRSPEQMVDLVERVKRGQW